jgi:cell division protein FtsI/penicillin-binding protein 2
LEAAVSKRVTLLLLMVVTLAVGIGARLTYLQVYSSDKLRGKAAQQHQRTFEVPATRGAILDRQGRELALSLKTHSLFAHAHRVENPQEAARELSKVLKLSQREILDRLTSGKRFVYLERFLEPEQLEAVQALGLPIGDTEPFGLHESSKRYYPRDELAVHVVGYAGVDGNGIEGIERRFDYELSGDPSIYHLVQDGLAGRVRQTAVAEPDKHPWDVVLSIDVVLQFIVERELDRAMRESGARAASAVLLDPATGQVMALANRPTVNANRYNQASDAARINRALVHQYEPGSTFKVITMAAALEHGNLRLQQQFDCEGGLYTYRGRRIRDISRNRILTAREVFERSSNVGMVKIVRRVKPHALRETILNFGFGERSGIELPGETPGTVHPVARWSGQTQPSLAFGYEVGVNVLQMASALAAIANDGVLVPPRIVLGVRDELGRVRRARPPEATRVIDSRIASELTSLMEGVVLRGTGTRARIDGYRVAGKSGTARKIVDGRYSDQHYVASFGGFGPVSSPSLVGLVVVDTPLGERYGGQVAAPVFRRIMEDALSHVRAPGDDGGITLAGPARRPAAGEIR